MWELPGLVFYYSITHQKCLKMRDPSLLLLAPSPWKHTYFVPLIDISLCWTPVPRWIWAPQTGACKGLYFTVGLCMSVNSSHLGVISALNFQEWFYWFCSQFKVILIPLLAEPQCTRFRILHRKAESLTRTLLFLPKEFGFPLFHFQFRIPQVFHLRETNIWYKTSSSLHIRQKNNSCEQRNFHFKGF